MATTAGRTGDDKSAREDRNAVVSVKGKQGMSSWVGMGGKIIESKLTERHNWKS